MICNYCSLKGVRENNQDSVMFASVKDGMMDVKFTHHNGPDDYEIETILPNDTWIAIVADGMGGLSNGEKASFLTISLFLDNLESSYLLGTEVKDMICEIIHKTSDSVRINSPESGSTIVGCMHIDGRYYLFNVGDSISLAYDGNIIKRSESHSLNEQSHVITDYIGMEGHPDVRVSVIFDLKRLMMFSDGMDNLLDEVGNELVLTEKTSSDLCQEAMEKGSQDNITCIKVI